MKILLLLLIPVLVVAAPPTQEQLDNAQACTDTLVKASLDLRKFVIAARNIMANSELAIPGSTETVTIPTLQLNRVVDIQEYQRRKAKVSDAYTSCP